MSRAEELLWELPRGEEELARPLPDDEALRAYRAGELDEQARTRLEWELARSSAARARLLELAGAEPADAAVDRVRGRLFPVARPRRLWAVAAGLAGVVALGATLWLMTAQRAAPDPSIAALELNVRVEGLASVRSLSPAADAPVEARADTRVRISAQTRGAARAGLGWALYRQDADVLQRVDRGPAVRVEPGRGAVEFSAPASELVGNEPGDYRLFVVAAEPGRLSESVELSADGEASARLSEATGGSVVARTLRIVPRDRGER